MKNAMKKLMSLLLVAVLVVGMIPFGASAAEIPFVVQVNSKEVVSTYATYNETLTAAQIAANVNLDFANVSQVWCNGAQIDKDATITVTGATTVDFIANLCTNNSSCTANSHAATCPNQYCPNGCGCWIGDVANHKAGCQYFTCGGCGIQGVNASQKGPQHGENCNRYLCANCNLPKTDANHWGSCKHVTVSDKCSTPQCNTSATAAKWTHIANCPEFRCRNCNLAANATGHTAPCEYAPAIEDPITPPTGGTQQGGTQQGGTQQGGTQQGGTQQGGTQQTSRMYVDVIISPNKTSNFTTSDYYRCELVEGKITTADRNAIAGLIAGKNIGAWKRQDNGMQAYTLLDFNFSDLQKPINILPVQNTTTNNNSSSNSNTNTGVYNKFPYNVYLNIYKDTMVGSPDKSIDITNGIALDGLVSLGEVKTVVANYYNAKNSYGIGFDGLYLARGNWVADYVADTHKYNEIAAGQMRQTGYVYINVMISNATAKGAATADRTNPKTGDSIYTAFTVMGLSAASLAAVMYFYNKKRYTV